MQADGACERLYQKQVVITMYNRSKYHKYQTVGMIDSMKVYRKWLKAHKVKV
jgi:hypothetical protein